MAKKEVYVWMSQKMLDDFHDPKQCFGNKKGGYDPKDKNCTKANCCDLELCKQLSKGGVPVLEGTKPTLVKSKEEIIESKADVVDWNRETVLAVVKEVIVSKGDTPEVVSTATRDKVFVGEDDIFVVTKRALKIHRLERGEKLGIAKELWKTDNKGIVVAYDSSLDFKKIVKNALDGLSIESLPQPEIPKVKTDLFDTDTEVVKEDKEKFVTSSIEETVEEVTEVVPDEPTILEVDVEVTGELTEEFTPEEFNKGEVTKVLTITSYSNGYNEIGIVFKGDVDEMLNKIRGIVVQ